MSRGRGGIGDGRNHQLGGLDGRGNARELNRQLPLCEEMADEAVIRGILTGLGRVFGPIQIRRRTRPMARARQRVEARSTERDRGVEREHRADQEMSNDSRHRNIIDE